MHLLIISFFVITGYVFVKSGSAYNGCSVFCQCDENKQYITCRNDAQKNITEKSSITIKMIDFSHSNISYINASRIDHLENLRILNLSDNQIKDIHSNCQKKSCNFTDVEILDLSHNTLISLPENILHPYTKLINFNASFNKIRAIDESLISHTLVSLDLSHNQLTKLSSRTFHHLQTLQVLNLSDNMLQSLEFSVCSGLPNLKHLNLNNNHFTQISGNIFANCVSLTNLYISNMPYLTSIYDDAFIGLNNLSILILKENRNLQFFSDHLLKPVALSHLDISYNKIVSCNNNFWVYLQKVDNLFVGGNPFQCNCDSVTLWEHIVFNKTHPKIMDKDKIYCDNDRLLQNLHKHELLCFPAIITQNTENTTFKMYNSAILNCSSLGSPQPTITWITPHNRILQYDPIYGKIRKSPNLDVLFSSPHLMDTNAYTIDYELSERMNVIENGSLVISYTLSQDGGPFKCIAHNKKGHSKVVVTVYLDYKIVQKVKWRGIAVGLIAAASFLLITIIFGTIRAIYEKNDPVKIKKRKSITEILEILDNYRTEQLEKLTAFTAEKVDKLSAYRKDKFDQLFSLKSYKVNELKNAPKLTLTTIALYLKWMKLHYSSSATNIKETCIQQGDRIKEQYIHKVDKFNDNRRIQMDKIRLQYNAQVLCVQEFGTKQMESLREQYKTHLQQILKLLELIEIGNCKSVIEEEYNNTEKLLFDHNKILELKEAIPISTIAFFYGYTEDSEYDTASSGSNIHLSHSVRKSDSVYDSKTLEKDNSFNHLHSKIYPKLRKSESSYSNHNKRHLPISNSPNLNKLNRNLNMYKCHDWMYDGGDNDSMGEDFIANKRQKKKKCRCSKHKKRANVNKATNGHHIIEMYDISNNSSKLMQENTLPYENAQDDDDIEQISDKY